MPGLDWEFVVVGGTGFKLLDGGTRRLRVLATEELLAEENILE